MRGRPQTDLDKAAQKLFEKSVSKCIMNKHKNLSWYDAGHNTKSKYRRLAWERLNVPGAKRQDATTLQVNNND